MTQPAPTPDLQYLVPAALESVATIEGCYPVLAKMELSNDERTNVAIALLYGSLEQARSACFLVAHDVGRSIFGALILLRSQVDQLMRAAFFAGPATAEELSFYLGEDELPRRDGNKLGPRSLSRINEAHFGWTPVGRIPNTVDNSWATLSGMTHGGRALLNYYIGEDGIGAYPPSDEFVEVLTNAVVLTHLAVATALSLARNSEADDLQTALRAWHGAGNAYFCKWASSKLEEKTAPIMGAL
ncbi:hypothetical protein [Xanthomonas sp. SHU 199]|uniref:hypothetical protein n=1 Tax=Xanthomonas sp. SHU 199 TaxID=1591174 RepID=UPI0012FEB610|nr:hypothetical protein [Xanthomonas sp. SHU 199]